MMKNYLFVFFLFFCAIIYSQENGKLKWNDDLTNLENNLLQKDYLFKTYSKTKFKTEINNLKSTTNLTDYWEINKILSYFKILNLVAEKPKLKTYPFKIKAFKNGYFITQITKENNYTLGFKLTKINGFTIAEIIEKMKTIFYLPHQNSVENNIEKYINSKTLLSFLKITKKDTLKLTLESENKKTEHILLPFIKDIDTDLLVKIIPKKELFNQRKTNTWFWKYGINFGKQVFLKYQVCLSKEHINKLIDSLNMTPLAYSKAFKIPLQKVYDAPELNPFLEKVAEKFEKRSYKKLIIDFRDNTKGAFLSSEKLLKMVKQIKRINKKGHLYILTNKNTNAAAIATILAFKNQTKVKIFGAKIFGTKEDSDKTNYFELVNSKVRINFPTIFQKEINIKPNILVQPTLNQYKKGVDALLQIVLDD